MKHKVSSSTHFGSSLIPRQRIESLEELLHLEHERVTLQESLRSIQSKIIRLQSNLFSSKIKDTAHIQVSDEDGFSSRMARGELRKKIFSLLSKAGDSGMSVKDIANSLGMKNVNIHSWFHAARRRLHQIQKVAPGVYRLHANSSPTQPEHSQQAVSAKPGEPSPKSANRLRSKRGEVSRKILELLEKAGPRGLKVSEIAHQLGAPYRTVHVWLSSTGKKSPNVLRAARGTYQWIPGRELAPAPSPAAA